MSKVDLDPNREDIERATNVGSYVGEYIGSYGKPLFERSVEELPFRTAVWATGIQMVRFSNGANEYINCEIEADGSESQDFEFSQKEEFNPTAENPGETVDGAPVELVKGNWSLEGVGRVDREGEAIYKVKMSVTEYVEIGDAQHLDPPNNLPSEIPTPPQNRI